MPLGQQIATGFSIWPTGLVPFDFFARLGESLPSSRYEILSAMFLVANIILWAVLGYAALIEVRRQIDAPERAGLTTALLVWTLGALSFGVLVGNGPNYGGSIYPFLYLFLAAFFFSPAYRVPRWAALGIVLVFSAATVVQASRTVRLHFAWQADTALERAMYDALSALPQAGHTVYVVNAPRGLASAPHHLNRAWSLNLDIVIVNQFSGCTISADPGSTQLLDSSADLISIRIPDCAAFNFGAATPAVLTNQSGVALKRDGICMYSFPAGSAAPGTVVPEWGTTLALQLDAKETSLTVIGYNWQSGVYEVISPRNTIDPV
jgi:hypothetical protein